MNPERATWPDIMMSGLIAGVVWTVLSIASISLFGHQLLEQVRTLTESQLAGRYFLLANFGAALWAMWLYSLVYAAKGKRTSSIAISATGWWFIQSLQSSKWVVAVVPEPASALPMLGATYLAMLASVAAGAMIQRWAVASREGGA